MHGLRLELLTAQTEALNIKSSLIELPEMPSMETYEDIMLKAVTALKDDNFTHSAFGDIYLEDLKVYRETQLATQNIKTVFPLWKRDTTQLITEFLALGFKTIVVCANSKYFDKDFVGTIIDEHFIDNLPEGVDPCGENGEFHTFCLMGQSLKTQSRLLLEKKYTENIMHLKPMIMISVKVMPKPMVFGTAI